MVFLVLVMTLSGGGPFPLAAGRVHGGNGAGGEQGGSESDYRVKGKENVKRAVRHLPDCRIRTCHIPEEDLSTGPGFWRSFRK